MRKVVDPLLTLPNVKESEGPDWSADLNYFVPWHWLAENEPLGPSIAFYTHCNKGHESLLTTACSRSQAVIAMSEDGKSELVKLGVITPIIVANMPSGGYTPRKRRVLIVGSEQPNGRKRSWLLLELAWKTDLSPFHFIVVGTGWEDVVKTAQNMGVSIEHHKLVDDSKLESLYQNSDCLLVTGFTEGGPLPLLEALSCGIPVISPNCGYAKGFHDPNLVKTYDGLPELQTALNELTLPLVNRWEAVSAYNIDSFLEVHRNVFSRVIGCDDPGTPTNRYDWVKRIVGEIHPKTLLEIGTGNGQRALDMITEAQKHCNGQDVVYLGFDLFRTLTDGEMRYENSKQPSGLNDVYDRLRATGARIVLWPGFTRDTLKKYPRGAKVDFVFVDGGHSWQTIQDDWDNLQTNFIHDKTVILFDDYYENAPEEVKGIGCQKLIDNLGPEWKVQKLDPVEDWPQHDRPFNSLKIRMVRVTRGHSD